ncbi:MAG: protein kinase [Pseudomonadota bacterium]
MGIDPGDIIDERYLVKNIMAEGGMGAVYAGVHMKLGRNVAIKILKTKHLEDEEQTARFLQEAQAAAELHHRNIVDVIDIGTLKDEAPYFVMELLVGESLRDRMRSHLPMAPREIGYIVKQTLAGLAAAHSRGIIHRDIKPSNIFISREIDGREIIKILDFGISKLAKNLEDPESQELTEDGTVLGTPLYMSPEQAAGKKERVDQRTDIYACGVILYKALTGVHPYKGRNYNEIMHSIFTSKHAAPSSLNPQITPEMERVINKAMSKEPEGRFRDADEFIKEMTAFMVETTHSGLVLPRVQRSEASETPPSLSSPSMTPPSARGGGPGERPAPSASPRRPVTPVSGPSLVGKGAWEELGGYHESSKIMKARPMMPWLLVLPFSVILLIVGGILLILAGKYVGSGKSKAAGKGASTAYTSGDGAPGEEKSPPKAKETFHVADSDSVLVTLTDLPKGSFIFIDNELMESNPIRMPRSFKKPVMVKVEAEGFDTYETQFVPSVDITLPVDMQESKKWDGAQSPSGGGKKKGKKPKEQQLDLLTDFPE